MIYGWKQNCHMLEYSRHGTEKITEKWITVVHLQRTAKTFVREKNKEWIKYSPGSASCGGSAFISHTKFAGKRPSPRWFEPCHQFASLNINTILKSWGDWS